MPSIQNIARKRDRKTLMGEVLSTRQMWARSQVDDSPLDLVGKGYRPISGLVSTSYGSQATSPSDVPEFVHKRMQAICLYLYQSNPIGRMLVNHIVDYTVGRGVRVISDDARVQQIIDAFWEHPHNNMSERVRYFASELAIYGELLHSVEFGDSGVMFLGGINPTYIRRVVPSVSDFTTMTEVHLISEYLLGDKGVITLPTIGKDGLLEGDGAFAAINRASNATRGTSDLLPLADILGDLDDLQFARVQRAKHFMYWFWDVTYEGASESQIREYANLIKGEAIHPGSIRAHNDKVKWDAKQPGAVANSDSDVYESGYNAIMTGAQIPNHWTGYGTTTGTGAEAANDPAFRRLGTRQRVIASYIKILVNMQLDEMVRKRVIPDRVRRDYTIHMPVVAVRDLQRLGGAAEKIVETLRSAEAAGYISPEMAQQYALETLESLGVQGVIVEGGPAAMQRRRKLPKPKENGNDKPSPQEKGDDEEEDDAQAQGNGQGNGGDDGEDDDNRRRNRRRRRSEGESFSA